MKQIWPTYAYSPTTNVLTLTGLNIDRDQLLLVTAADRGRIMYNFADSTVTASAFTAGANTGLTLVASTAGLTTTAALVIYYDDQLASTTVTVSSLPAISGTVTANVNVTSNIAPGISDYANNYAPFPVAVQYGHLDFVAGIRDGDGNTFGVDRTFPVTISDSLPAGSNLIGQVQISGQITSNIAAGTARIGVVTIGGGTVTIGAGTQQIGSVTASISNFPATQAVSLTTLPALVAGTAQIGSVTASISNTVTASISGTVPVSISSVTVGNSVTIGSLPAISGTVTINPSISSSAITSGSFTSLTSATLVPANTTRKMATVYNLGAGQLFINAGVTATTLGGGFMVSLYSGDFYECDYTTTTLSAIFATAGTASWVSH